MAYVISYGPLDREEQIARETASDALAAVLTLQEEGACNMVVTLVETAQNIVGMLKLLASHELPIASACLASSSQAEASPSPTSLP